MHYMVGLYGAPADADHFRRHYLTTHLPLAAKLPGLVRMHHSFAVETLGAGETYFCIWTGAAISGPAISPMWWCSIPTPMLQGPLM